MMGMGNNLVELRLANGQTLNAETLHRQFGSKIVWLLPTKSLQVTKILIQHLLLHMEII